MKTCTKCNESKSFESFSKDKHKIDGYRTVCRLCSSLQKKEAYKNQKLVIENIADNKTCSTCEVNKISDHFDRDKRKEDGLAWECKECRSIRNQKMYQNNKPKRIQKSSNYYYANKEKIGVTRRKYQNKREKTDILYRLSRRLRNRLYYALKRAKWKKGIKFNEYIGCSLEELKIHLEVQFTENMTWDNYGIGEKFWNIDHIIPLSKAKTEEEICNLCHFTNLQPMWFIENVKKSNK